MNPKVYSELNKVESRIGRLRENAKWANLAGVATLINAALGSIVAIDLLTEDKSSTNLFTFSLAWVGLSTVVSTLAFRDSTANSRTADALEVVSAQARIGMTPQLNPETQA